MSIKGSLYKEDLDTILVLDFGSQYTQLIARRVRELGVFSEIFPWDIDTHRISSLNPNGIILLHDCLPNNFFAQAIPRCQYNWNGDVWKSIVECRTKKDLDTYTCYADHGIGVIFKRKNQNILNVNIKDFSKINFKEYFYNYKKYMNIIEYNDLIKIM